MTDQTESQGDGRNRRLPGNRVVRRRVDATQIIPIPEPLIRPSKPTVQAYARRFVAAFVLLVVLGTLVLMLPAASESGQRTNPIDALFTAVSALAVTGLVVVDTQEHWSLLGEVVILILIQIGGLGFTVGASLILITIGGNSGLRTALMAHEGTPKMPLSEIVAFSRRIVRFVLASEAIGATLLSLRFLQDMSPPVAVWHGIFSAVSAFCNAGFDLNGGYTSMLGYQQSVWVNLTVMGLIQAGALSYIVLSDAWKSRRWHGMGVDTKLVLLTNASLLGLGVFVFLAVEWNRTLASAPTAAKPLIALFQSVAARTAGFASVNFGEASDATLLFWLGLMLVGGASGSTAGGVKLATMAIVVVAMVSTLRGHPETQVFRRRIAPSQVFLAMAIIGLFLATHFLLTLLVVYVEAAAGATDKTFVALMFETMSAAATVGISTGITPEMSEPGKLILCFTMFFGRLGPLTLAYAVTRRQTPARYRFAETRVRLG